MDSESLLVFLRLLVKVESLGRRSFGDCIREIYINSDIENPDEFVVWFTANATFLAP